MAAVLNRRAFLKLSLAATGNLAANWLSRGPLGAVGLKGSVVPLALAQGVCPTLVQSPWLGMVALGDNTMDDPNKGNHLRWAFEPRLGFPDGGFDLYRRPHYEAAPVCATLQQYTSNQNLGRRITIGNLIFESTSDMRTVELVAGNVGPEIDLRNHPPIAMWPREVCHRVQVYVVDFSSGGGTIRAIAYGGNAIVDVAMSVASPNIQILDLAADHIDRVMLVPGSGPMNGALTQVCTITVASDACTASPGWTHLNDALICLPLADEAYPSHLLTQASEWPTASARIPPAVRPTYDPPEFTHLRDTLARIYNPSPDPLITTSTPCPPALDGGGAPSFDHDPLGVVLMTTLDPYIARMLGLYWIDGVFYVGQALQGPVAATVGTAYDYLIVAHYPATAENADPRDDWDLDVVGTIINGTVHHGSLTYVTSLALSVDNHPIVDFDTDNALSIPDNLGSPLRIILPEPAQAVELHVDVPDADARALARAYSNGVEVDTHMRSASVNGPTTLLLVAESIDTVEVEGRDLYLAEVWCYTDYLPGGDIGYIVYNVTLGAPLALSAPSYLSGDALPVLTGRDRSCSPVTGQMAVGLRWDRDVSGDGVAPGGAVLFDLDRQGLGNGDTPDAITPQDWVMAKRNILVAPSPPGADCEPYEPLPGWPAQRPDYIDVPIDMPDGVQQRWYVYRVCGRDIFGRSSAYRESSTLDLADTVPPPPPADVHAKYLDPDDPYLAPDEHAWTHPQDGPRHGLRVGWRWTANLQEQAPDVAQFRVYWKTGRLNVLVGNITAVGAPDAEGNVLLTTDTLVAGLPAGDVHDAFKGEWLAQGVNLYQVVASGSSKDSLLTLTAKRIKWDAPLLPDKLIRPAELQPMPKPGTFSVSFHPEKLLAGTITAVGQPGFNGPGTIDTNVLYTGVAHDLVDKKLRQAGRLWTIRDNMIDAESGKLQLSVHARACEPHMPNSGESFLVVTADGMTPHLLDVGNPHWRDYRDPLNWQQRLHLEPRTAEPKGFITAVTDNGNGTSAVATDQHLADDSDHYLGGELTVDDFTWPVIGYTTAVNLQLTVLNVRRNRATGEVTQDAPQVGDTFIYWPDIAIPIAELTLDPGQPAAYAVIGVSAADDKTYVADTWLGDNGGQTGNESRVSPPAIVARVDRNVPQAVTPNQDVLMATPADFFGHSRFTVRWEKGDSNLRYRVYRALARSDENEPPPVDPPENEPPRYRLLTPEPLRAQDCADFAEEGHAWDDDLLAYQDTLDGKSASHYYYRVRAVNAAGQLGDWSEAIGPVECPDVVPPRTPAITKVLGGDRQITLQWASNREPDLIEYRVYRTDSKDKASDLRLMGQPLHTEIEAYEPPERPAEMTWVDSTVSAMTTYYYRMVAVDQMGNVSAPSPPFAARAFDNSRPDPPTWNPAQLGPEQDSVLLAWSSAVSNLRCLVQRYNDDTSTWENISGWLEAGLYAYIDDSRAPGAQYVYRLRVMNAAGKTNSAYNELTA